MKISLGKNGLNEPIPFTVKEAVTGQYIILEVYNMNSYLNQAFSASFDISSLSLIFLLINHFTGEMCSVHRPKTFNQA